MPICRRASPHHRIAALSSCLTLLTAILFFTKLSHAQSWLPAPSGPYPVGTFTIYLTDNSRPEIVTRDTSDRRRFIAHVYYPAAFCENKDRHRRYLDDYPREAYKLARRFLGLDEEYFDDSAVNVQTHACYEVYPADSGAPFPVVTVSHGYLSSPIVQTHMCEQLASNGYIAVAINHTYESTGAAFPDSSLAKPQFKFLRRAMVQGPQMPFLLAMKPGERKARRTSRAIRWGRAMTERAQVWLQDIGFVLETLDSINSAQGMFRGVIDTRRVGTFGHSFGGTAAGFACAVDLRIRCAVNMDGFQYGVPIDGPYNGPVMLVESDQFHGINDMCFAGADPFFRLHVKGARHTGLTDVSMWPNLGEKRFRRRIGTTGIAQIVDTHVLAFFNHALKNGPLGPIEQIRERRGAR